MTHPLRMRVCLPIMAAIAAALALPAAAPAADLVPGQVIVRYAPGSSGAERADARDDAGTAAIEGLGMARAQLLEITDGDSVAATVRQLETDPNVAYAEPNGISRPAMLPNDPQFLNGNQWGLYNDGQTVNGVTGTPDADIETPAAWNVVTGDTDTVVAVMDTGADFAHPDLVNELWVNPGETADGFDNGDPGTLVDDINGYDFIGDGYDGSPASLAPDADPRDLSGHGTHVSGIALAQGNNGIGVTGVSQRAALMSLRICGTYDSGCPDSALIQAINYAADHGARVVNGSIAGGSPSSAVSDALESHPNTLYVFAAGNGDSSGNGVNNDVVPNSPCTADEGSGYSADNVICVAATTQSDRRADFSNYGAGTVDLGAPGVNILSTSSRINLFSDDFETGDISGNWTNTGASTWAASVEPPHSGSFGITDSPGGDYASGTTNEVTSDAATLAPLGVGEVRSCELDYFRDVDLASGDSFVIEVLLDGSVAGPPAEPPNHTSRNGFIELGSQFDVGGQVQVRLRVTSDSNPATVDDGVHMDNVDLVCHGSPSSNGYEFLNGTSMATPMVTGAAALLYSDDPGAGASGVKAALLDGVDPVADLTGTTVSGGRLDVYGALTSGSSNPAGGGGGSGGSGSTPGAGTTAGSSNQKPNTFFKRKPGKVVETDAEKAKVVFRFGSTEPNSTFRCLLDSVEYQPGSKKFVRRLVPARHVLKVRAVDSGGASDPTAAVYRFRVKRVGPQP